MPNFNSIDLVSVERNDGNRILAYQNSPWSALCRAARNTAGDHSGVNYATFWFTSHLAIGGLGVGVTTYHATQPSSNVHSEKNVWLLGVRGMPEYQAMAVPNWTQGQYPAWVGARSTAAQIFAATGCRITNVYTERQPCGGCSPFLDDVLMAGTPVYWHFPYVSKNTKKHERDDEDEGMLLLATFHQGVYFDEKRDVKAARKEFNKSLKKAV